MQEAFFEFQHASSARLSSFYNLFTTSKVLSEISNCLLELEMGFGLSNATCESILQSIPPVLQIFASPTNIVPNGADPTTYREFILVATMWYLHIKFLYQFPMYRSLGEIKSLSSHEWNLRYSQFSISSNRILAAGSLLLIIKILLDCLSINLKRFSSTIENTKLSHLKVLSSTFHVALNRLRLLTISDDLYPYFNYLQKSFTISQTSNQSEVYSEESDEASSLLLSLSKRHEIETVLLQEYCKYLSKLFSTCINDRSSNSLERQSMLLYTGASILKFYTNLDRVRMCTPVFRSLENSTNELLAFPLKDQVFWHYQRSLLLIIESKYQPAKAHFSNAIKILLPQIIPLSTTITNTSKFRNMLKILSFLVPLEYYYSRKLFVDNLLLEFIKFSSASSTSLLSLSSLNSFIALCKIFKELFATIKNDNIPQFSDIICANEKMLQSKNLLELFLFLFKPLILRNFVKKIYSLTRHFDSENRLSLVYLISGIKVVQRKLDSLNSSVKAFAWISFAFLDSCDETLDFQVEIIISVLISQGFIKGYIHHEKKVLVLSKINPFPSS